MYLCAKILTLILCVAGLRKGDNEKDLAEIYSVDVCAKTSLFFAVLAFPDSLAVRLHHGSSDATGPTHEMGNPIIPIFLERPDWQKKWLGTL